ncbi:cupin domain-containing protein [Ferruginibacter yonginensis]|uniref:Cupin domain-containing protein n=1 Tax=Ferruginibacter yonginensis TaxID=1310416 RepID=A0ABV8QQ37_9BACT
MKRKQFLWSTAAAIPAVLFGKSMAGNLPPKRPNKGFVVKAGSSKTGNEVMLGGKNANNVKVASKDTNGDLAIFEYIGKEKGGPPLHVHPHQDEIFFVVAGTYLFQVGDEQHRLQAGDTIFLPRTVPHTFAQLSDTGHLYFMFQPAGKMEVFFEALGRLKAPPSAAEGAALFAQHDMKVVGAPLAF